MGNTSNKGNNTNHSMKFLHRHPFSRTTNIWERSSYSWYHILFFQLQKLMIVSIPINPRSSICFLLCRNWRQHHANERVFCRYMCCIIDTAILEPSSQKGKANCQSNYVAIQFKNAWYQYKNKFSGSFSSGIVNMRTSYHRIKSITLNKWERNARIFEGYERTIFDFFFFLRMEPQQGTFGSTPGK